MFWRGFGREGWRSPWNELRDLQDTVNRIFRESYVPRGAEYPALNAYLNEDSAVITAEIPGIDPDSLDISVHDETLTLKGNRPEVQLGEGETFHRNERGAGSFSRTITLPFPVEAEKVEADYKRGVLTLTLPRAEQDKPRKITVKAS